MNPNKSQNMVEDDLLLNEFDLSAISSNTMNSNEIVEKILKLEANSNFKLFHNIFLNLCPIAEDQLGEFESFWNANRHSNWGKIWQNGAKNGDNGQKI